MRGLPQLLQSISIPVTLFCLLIFCPRGYGAEPASLEATILFDGFHYKNLEEFRKKWNIRKGTRLGPGANNWYESLVALFPEEGKVRLQATVEQGERKASGIGLKRVLPTTGTFAASVRFSGSSEPGHSSVKAFYTYAETPPPLRGFGTPNHLEHDFEIITEQRHCWLAPDNVLKLPILKTITHEYTDPYLSLKSTSHNRNDFISMSTIADDYMTLIVQVRQVEAEPTMLRNQSTYTLLGKTGEIVIGQTETLHPTAISHLLAKFNTWWLAPERCADKTREFPANRPPQYMDIQWFYYNSSTDIPPARIHRYGTLFDGGAVDTNQDGIPDTLGTE